MISACRSANISQALKPSAAGRLTRIFVTNVTQGDLVHICAPQTTFTPSNDWRDHELALEITGDHRRRQASDCGKVGVARLRLLTLRGLSHRLFNLLGVFQSRFEVRTFTAHNFCHVAPTPPNTVWPANRRVPSSSGAETPTQQEEIRHASTVGKHAERACL